MFSFQGSKLYYICKKPFGLLPFLMSGSHLSSRVVSNKVLSADQGLTVVFGMGTGISPLRIATGQIKLYLILSLNRSTAIQPLLSISLIR